ncbi:MAG: tetratricopeptide repeat protein [bacterium]
MDKKLIHYQVICAIILLGFVAFGATLKSGFIWDDHQMIEENPYITQWTIKNLHHNFSSDLFNQGLEYYRPIVTVFHMFDFSIWGMNPFGYHLTNLLLHIANAILIYFFVIRLFFNKEVAFLSSIFFVVHPIIVEQLLIIGGRSELLVNFFMLISILLFIQQRFIFRLLSLLAFVLSMLSKESGIITPLVLLLVLWFKNSKPKEFMWLIPFVIFIIPFLVLRSCIIDNPYMKIELVKLPQFLFLQLPEILFIYLRLLLFPFGLHSHRQLPTYGQEVWIFSILLLLLGVLLLIKRSKTGIFCFLWFIFMILPKSPVLMNGGFMIEHWLYSSSLSIFLPLAFLYQRCREVNSILYQKVTQITLLVILITYIAIANFNIAIRGNDFLMYQRAMKYSSSTPVIYNMGWFYYNSGDFEKALEYFQKALIVHPETPDYRNAVALALWRHTNNTLKPIEIFKSIKETHPNYISSYLNLGLIYLTNGRYKEAKEETASAIRLDPNSQSAWYQLAEICHKTNDMEKAKEYYHQTLNINPYYHLARNNLAAIYAEKGEYQKAKEHWEFILRYSPNNEFAKKNIARLNKLFSNRSL